MAASDAPHAPTGLHIAIPIHSFEPGGVERVALNLAAAWQDSGNRVSIVLGRCDGAMADHAPPLHFICRDAPFPAAPVETLWMIYTLWQFLRHNPVDVLFCPGNTYAIVGVMMRKLLGSRCPPIVIKISNDLNRQDMSSIGRRGYRQWLRIQGRTIARFVGMAEPMRDEIATATGLARADIAIIPDPALTDPQYACLSHGGCGGRVAGAHRFLAVGRLVEQKNYPMMIRAFAEAAPSHATLTILGDGPERARIEGLIARYGVSGRVRLVGYVPDTAHWFRSSSALLLSSHYEGVPAVVLEALAAGIPIIATDCSTAMPHLLGHGRFGVLTPTGDTAAFMRALATMNPAAFDKRGAIASAADYTVTTAAARYLSVLHEVAEAHRTATAPHATAPDRSTSFATAQDPSHV